MPTRREIARLQYALEASQAGDGVGDGDVGSASPKLPEGEGNEAAGTKRTADSIPSERPQKRRREEVTGSIPTSTRSDYLNRGKTGESSDVASSESRAATRGAVDKDISSGPVSKTKVEPVSDVSRDKVSSQNDVAGSSPGILKEAQEAAPVPSMYDEYFLRNLESGIDVIFNHVKSVKGIDLERVLGTEQGPSSVSSLIPGWSSLRVQALPSESAAGDTSPSALLDGAKFDAMARVFERKAAGRFGRKPADGAGGPGAERAERASSGASQKAASQPAAGGASDGSSDSPAGGLAFLPRTTASSAWWGITEGTEAPASSREWARQGASSGGSSKGGSRGGAPSAAGSSTPSSSSFYPSASSRRSGSGASGGAGVSGHSSAPSSSSSSSSSSVPFSSGRGGGGPGREHDWGARGPAGGGRRGDRSGDRGSGRGRDRGRDRAYSGGSGRRGAGSGSGSGARMQVQVQVQGGRR